MRFIPIIILAVVITFISACSEENPYADTFFVYNQVEPDTAVIDGEFTLISQGGNVAFGKVSLTNLQAGHVYHANACWYIYGESDRLRCFDMGDFTTASTENTKEITFIEATHMGNGVNPNYRYGFGELIQSPGYIEIYKDSLIQDSIVGVIQVPIR